MFSKKPQNHSYLKPFLFYFIQTIFGDFVAIFEKKTCPQKKIFKKIFFYFLEIAYFEDNSARFEEKIFFENLKKNFLKISHLEKSGNFEILMGFLHSKP